MVQTYDSLARDRLGSSGLCINKLGKGPSGDAMYQFQAPKSCGSEEEENFCFLLCFLRFEPKTP